MKKILYLHGLESSNVCDKVDFMRERANVLAPSIDYRKSNIEEELMYMVESFEPDLIIGSSMGGYCGLMLANYYNVECIAFNPASHSRPIEPNLKSLQYEDIHYDLTNKNMTREVGDIRWCSLDESLSLIRSYNVEKKEVLIRVATLLKKYCPFQNGNIKNIQPHVRNASKNI